MEVGMPDKAVGYEEELHAPGTSGSFGLTNEALDIQQVCLLFDRYRIILVGTAEEPYYAHLKVAGFQVKLLHPIVPKAECNVGVGKCYPCELIYYVTELCAVAL